MSRLHRPLRFAALAVAIVCATAPMVRGRSNDAPALVAPVCSTAQLPASVAEWARGAQLFDGLGTFHRAIATQSPQARQYFDQGMRYLWAFNHDESTRSFARAAIIDPQCAICYWGVALTVGPNLNVPMMSAVRAKVARDALLEAQRNSGQALPVEQALIVALSQRYPSDQALDTSNKDPVLAAYGQAMRSVAAKFPKDLDVQTLYAESLMTLNAWKLWSLDGVPAPGTTEILATLETVLKRDPTHPGANHYYVHAIEASPHPEKGLVPATRLIGMMPSAGHLEHMPAHIMQRVGRYEDAAEANRKGAAADGAYLAKARPPDYYSMYVAHNYQFLAYSLAMEGRRAETLDAARKMSTAMSVPMLKEMPGADWYMVEKYQALLRFGLWDDMLAQPRPDESLLGLTVGYVYAKGMANEAKHQLKEARSALTELRKIAASVPPDYGAGLNVLKDVTAIAVAVLDGTLALKQNERARGFASLRNAAVLEDHLAYDEPSSWFFPVRHLLGAQLLLQGKAEEAEAVYREDLKRNPDNGWALYGLSQALKRQQKDAKNVERDFNKAWQHADVSLGASAL